MSRVLGAALVLGALLAVGWVVLWFWGAAGSAVAFALLALTPVAVLGALLVAGVALGTRRWVVGGTALLAALVLAAVVLPRAVPEPGPPRSDGRPLVVATANLQFGRADAAALVALVRERRVDVLGLQELTAECADQLRAAGLDAELPHATVENLTGAAGTGLVSRYPLSPSGLTWRPGRFAQVTARIAAPGGPVDVVVVHPEAPVYRPDAAGWAAEITGLPGPAAPGGPARLLLGDFNATLDHRPLRELIGTGHRDAAAAVGKGLIGTWPTDRAFPPFAAIDHVLVSGPLRPAAAATRRLAGTDHAVLEVSLVP